MGDLSKEPDKIATFLKETKGLDKTKIGEYIGDRSPMSATILEHFVNSFNLTGMELDLGLRHFLSFFRIPGESQVIERIMEKLATKFYADNKNSTVFANSDAAFVLSYSIIMLATDLHNPNVKTKMTFKQWAKNNMGTNDGKHFPEPFLKGIYERIAKSPLRFDGKAEEEDKKHSRKPTVAPGKSR